MSTRGALTIVCLLMALLAAGSMLGGCAASGELTTQVCFMQQMGMTSEGYAVVMQACQSPEAFAASQR